MTLSTLSLLFVVGVLAHNAEEAAFLPQWSARAGRWHKPVTRAQFGLAVSVLSAMLVVCAVAAHLSGPRSSAAYIFAGYVLAMVANVAVPHLLGSIALRSYIPGTATAVLLNLPLGSFLLYRMVAEGQVQVVVLIWAAPLAAIGIALCIPVLLWLGAKLQQQARAPGTGGQSAA